MQKTLAIYHFILPFPNYLQAILDVLEPTVFDLAEIKRQLGYYTPIHTKLVLLSIY